MFSPVYSLTSEHCRMKMLTVFVCCLVAAVHGGPVLPVVPASNVTAVNGTVIVPAAVNGTVIVPAAVNGTIVPTPVNETVALPVGNVTVSSSNSSSEIPVDIFLKANFTQDPVVDFLIVPIDFSGVDAYQEREARFLGGRGLGLGLGLGGLNGGYGNGYDGYNGGINNGLLGGGGLLPGLGAGLSGLLGGRNRANSNSNAISNAGPFGTAISTSNSNAIAGNGFGGGGGLFRKRRSSPFDVPSNPLLDQNSSSIKTSNLVNNALFGTVQNVLSNTVKKV